LDVQDQGEALRRIREMGFFPTKVRAKNESRSKAPAAPTRRAKKRSPIVITIPGLGGRVRQGTLTIFTRQLATLIEAGMPLLRGLRTLEEQESNPVMRQVISELAVSIEGGDSLAEALARRPKIFNRLYLNMVKAGELGGALEVSLNRLAEFMEKARKIKGKIKSAMFYPCAVLVIATAILILLTVFVIPRFKLVFADMLGGKPLPAFTVFVLGISEGIKNHLLMSGLLAAGFALSWTLCLQTKFGRWVFDRLKLALPVLGPVFRKVAISRFARTLGTLVSSGVPILQSLAIVKETAGNAVVGNIISNVHENVKQGDPIAPTLKASGVFPAMIAGMVDVGEQTGALPEMLMKIADNCDEDVDNAANAMTSLLEPIMIVVLAVIVGSIVIAMFLPILRIIGDDSFGGPSGGQKVAGD
jgi:type IV pilus assembly protein PilC